MKGDWIQTYTGKKFYPLDPRPDDICLEDIAHALAHTCRYNGHSRVFYSVAEHCVRMSVANLPGDSRWLLMHDSAEAYLSDVPSPIKPMLPEFKVIENSILEVIGEKYKLGVPNHQHIKLGDMVMLATEKRDVLPAGPEWGLVLPEPLLNKIYPWPPEVAENLFLNTAKELEIV
jgi:hypothetical protein